MCTWFAHMFTWVCADEYSFILFLGVRLADNELLELHMYLQSAPQSCTSIKHVILQLLSFLVNAEDHVFIFA